MLDANGFCVHTARLGSAAAGSAAARSADAGSAGAPPAVDSVDASDVAPVPDHRAGDKMPVAGSDPDGALGSQLPVVGDWEGDGAAEGKVMEAEPSPSGQSSKGLSNSQVFSEDDEEEEKEESEKLTGAEKGLNSDIYSLEEINDFLDDRFGKSVKVKDYFQDTNKFIISAAVLQKQVGFEALNEKKR